MQITNQKLLAVVRELSAKQEQAEKEKDSQQVKQLEARLKLTEQQLADLKDNETRHYKALEIVKGQRDMYRTLFNQQVAGTAKGASIELPTEVRIALIPNFISFNSNNRSKI